MESTKLHEALNQMALECHNHEIPSIPECLKRIRFILNTIEANTKYTQFIMDKDKHAD